MICPFMTAQYPNSRLRKCYQEHCAIWIEEFKCCAFKRYGMINTNGPVLYDGTVQIIDNPVSPPRPLSNYTMTYTNNSTPVTVNINDINKNV